MVAALCFHVMFATCAIGGIHYGTGRHMAALSGEQQYKALRVSPRTCSLKPLQTNKRHSTGGYATLPIAGL